MLDLRRQVASPLCPHDEAFVEGSHAGREEQMLSIPKLALEMSILRHEPG